MLPPLAFPVESNPLMERLEFINVEGHTDTLALWPTARTINISQSSDDDRRK
jgi:hypothetical protein